VAWVKSSPEVSHYSLCHTCAEVVCCRCLECVAYNRIGSGSWVQVALHRSTHAPQVITAAVGMIAVRLGFFLCISVAITADTS
jgi:hypothetical protein